MNPLRQDGEGHGIFAMSTLVVIFFLMLVALEITNYAMKTRFAANLATIGAMASAKATYFYGKDSYLEDPCDNVLKAVCLNVDCDNPGNPPVRVICEPAAIYVSGGVRKQRYDIYVKLPYRALSPVTGRFVEDQVIGYAPATITYGISGEGD